MTSFVKPKQPKPQAQTQQQQQQPQQQPQLQQESGQRRDRDELIVDAALDREFDNLPEGEKFEFARQKDQSNCATAKIKEFLDNYWGICAAEANDDFDDRPLGLGWNQTEQEEEELDDDSLNEQFDSLADDNARLEFVNYRMEREKKVTDKMMEFRENYYANVESDEDTK